MIAVPVLNSAVHSVAQLGAGIGCGVLLDYGAQLLSPLSAKGSSIQNPKQAVVEVLECTAQVVASSIVVGVLFNYLAGLGPREADPTSGMLFALVFFNVAQPGLQQRLKRIVDYAQALLVQPLMGADSTFGNPYRADSVPATAQDQSYRLRQGMMRRNGFADVAGAEAQVPLEGRQLPAF